MPYHNEKDIWIASQLYMCIQCKISMHYIPSFAHLHWLYASVATLGLQQILYSQPESRLCHQCPIKQERKGLHQLTVYTLT